VLTTSPWAFQLHPGPWLVILALGALYGTVVRRPGLSASRRQVAAFFGGLAVLLVALTWPLADLAAHWLLTALVLQRLLLTLAVPALLIIGTPAPLMARLTRPPVIDVAVRTVSHPIVAIAVVTAICIGTLTTAAVDAQATSALARAAMDLALLVAGVALWTPVLNRLPGTRRPSVLGQAAYLIVQAIVPSFLSVVWIFARHPLYPAYRHAAATLSLSPLVDQQVAGFVAKLSTIAVLWTVAFVLLSRAQRVTSAGGDPEPLLWSDVARHIERAERRQRRSANAGFPTVYPDTAPPEDRPEAPPGPGP
jgi:cytochrome c oxidase assembly factor CtaG